MTNASAQFNRYDSNAVVVPKGTAFTPTGRAHKASRAARIREARLMRPDLADFGVVEVVFGSRDSVDTVVIFDPEWTAAEGL